MRISSLVISVCLCLPILGVFGCSAITSDDAPITAPVDNRTGKSDDDSSDQPETSDNPFTSDGTDTPQNEPSDMLPPADDADNDPSDPEEVDAVEAVTP